MKIKAVLFLSTFLILVGCSNQGGDTTKEADIDAGAESVGGEFSGQAVYDLPNEQFSESALDMLVDCGLTDDDIARLEMEILPQERPESGPYRDVSGNEIADISLEQLEPGIFEVFCVPKDPSVWLDAGRELILFSASRAITDDSDGELYLMGADGNGFWRLTNNDWHDYDPDWSAVRSRIVFRAGYIEDYDIFTMDIDGTNIRQLTDNSRKDVHPSWSPDGSKIVFSSDRDGDYDIYSMNADGSGVQQLTQNDAYELDPEWSPDGSKIVYISDNDGDQEIYIMSTDGSNIQQLTENDRDDRKPTWSPDGTTIAFISDLDRDREIFTMNADGTNIHQLTSAELEVAYPAWSADGSLIAYQSHVVVDRVAHSMLFTIKSDGTNTQPLFDEIQVDWGFSSSEWVTQTVVQPRITAYSAGPTETPTVTTTPTTTEDEMMQLGTIHMTNKTDGWRKRESSLFTTRDGGHTWRDVTPQKFISDDLYMVAFEYLDENHAWVIYDPYPGLQVGYGCIAPDASILYTTDGGETWDASQPLMHDLADMSCRASIDMIDSQKGWLSINGWYTAAGLHTEMQLFQTADGGNTWEALEATWCYSEDSCSSYTPGWISEKAFYGQSGWLLENMHECYPCYGNVPAPAYHVTTDYGANWYYRYLPSPTGNPDFYEQYFFCEPYQLNLITDKIIRLQLACYQYESDAMPGPKDYVYASDDGGLTWTTHELPSSSGLMLFFDKYHGLLLGHEMWRTEDGGATWDRINTVIWDGQFSFIDPWYGWAVAKSEEGEISLVYTTNGAETWKMLYPENVPSVEDELHSNDPSDDLMPDGALMQLAASEEHPSRVTSVAFSPDGETLASGSSDTTVILWDAQSGERLAILEGHENVVDSVAFSPDGEILASGAKDKIVILWDAHSGERLATLKGLTHDVNSVAFSPDGETLASGALNDTVILWKASSGDWMATLDLNRRGANSVAFSPDGDTLASAMWEKTVILWDAHSGEILATLEGHNNIVYSVAFSPDGETLASGSEDKTAILWNAHSGEILATLKGHTGVVLSVAFSPDGEILASGSLDDTVILWDTFNGEHIATLEGHAEGVVSVAFSPDGRTLASGSQDGTIVIWDMDALISD